MPVGLGRFFLYVSMSGFHRCCKQGSADFFQKRLDGACLLSTVRAGCPVSAPELPHHALWLERGIDYVCGNGPGRVPIKLYLQGSQRSPGTVVSDARQKGRRSRTAGASGVSVQGPNRMRNSICVSPDVHLCVCIHRRDWWKAFSVVFVLVCAILLWFCNSP